MNVLTFFINLIIIFINFSNLKIYLLTAKKSIVLYNILLIIVQSILP